MNTPVIKRHKFGAGGQQGVCEECDQFVFEATEHCPGKEAQVKEFKDSGQRQNFETGAVRDVQQSKGRYDLIPPFATMLLSRIYEEGCKKYGDRNFEKGIPIERYVDSAKRHIEKYQAGMRDEPHLSMAAWNLMSGLFTASMITLGLRSKSLFNLPNHTGAESAHPLSPFEIEALEQFIGRKIE